MRNSKHNFTEAMDNAKEINMTRRNRGLGAGKAAKGWTRGTVAPVPEKGTYDRLRASVGYAWACHSSLAIEDYMRAVYPERYDVGALTLGAWS